MEPVRGCFNSSSVSQILGQVPNKSLFASVFGLGLQRLGTFNTPDNLLIKLNMLPAYRTLLRNRQISVISRSLVKMWILIFMIMTLWTGGLVLPQYLESQVGSRGFESSRKMRSQHKRNSRASQQKYKALMLN